MSIVPVFGHGELREQIQAAVIRGTLPATILFQGPRGVGKQRLALWLGQLLLCERLSPNGEPCGTCRSCKFSLALTHPDLHWFFPRLRLKNQDDLDDVRDDYAEAAAERAESHGLYAPPSGMEGIFVAAVRFIVQQAALSPAISTRKVFIIGDAERMVAQEGNEFAANAFLKLLEEPPANMTIVLTSSEPGALLPTIRSRAASFRIPPITPDEVRMFLADERVIEHLKGEDSLPASVAERVEYADGAPGRLLSGAAWSNALDQARKLMDAVTGKPVARYEAAWTTASSKARGSFADTLDALTFELHGRARDAVRRGAERDALAATRAVEAVELAKERVTSNVSPQLITVNLLREIRELFN